MSFPMVKAVRDLLTGATSVANLLLNLIAGSPSTGQFLQYNGSAWVPAAAGARTVSEKTSSYTVLTGDAEKELRGNHATVAVDFTLPAASTMSGSALVFTRKGAAAQSLIPDGTDKIAGVNANYEFAAKESIMIRSDGTDWILVAG